MTKTKNILPEFTIKQMLEAGVHFGHKTMRRNPKMSKYIFGNRNRLSIINLETTAQHLHNALKTVKEVAKNNGRILFVATKKQAYEAVKESAKRSGQYYVNNRWLGGMLTNWKTISGSIKTLKKAEDQLADENSNLNKKERLVLDRQRIKLDNALGGIRNMGGSPDLVFVIDIRREHLAIAEAKKLGVPIMAILDTNVDPDGITYPIPGNDDSVKAIKLYCRLISDAILEGMKENMAIAGVDVSKIDSSEQILEVAESKEVKARQAKAAAEKPVKKTAVKAKPAQKPVAKKAPAKTEAAVEAKVEVTKPAVEAETKK
ncbi:MAG: small subunit ribosomal protein S2 [Lentimonas sp.]|jgi:small subunit ribosomal protein S2